MSAVDSSNVQIRPMPHLGAGAVEYLGLHAIERRRRPLTMLFGVCMGFLLLDGDHHWPVQGWTRELLFVAGISLAAIGTLGRTWSNLFISGYKTKYLIQTGPYSMCRNPLYFFSAIGMLGIGLCCGNLAIPLVMTISFAIYYPWIIRSEESRLAAAHGDEFTAYCRRTPAFWPQLSHYEEPEAYTMIPRIMRKNIADAYWFIPLAALAHVVSGWHLAPWLTASGGLW
ncbi:MAG: isoprenylcysteine carboxylmethyltransferase family protein [Planctomyces sp.]|jgi:protein-S-isoprenylcysteine O-methyltransferase Ste14|nr:isoprenylcysteine carboxylmethyltransferase family protein [Planctomyces sp.]